MKILPVANFHSLFTEKILKQMIEYKQRYSLKFILFNILFRIFFSTKLTHGNFHIYKTKTTNTQWKC